MNHILVAVGLVLTVAVFSTEALKCVVCDACTYSEAVGIATSDCGSDKYCFVTAESGQYRRGCASSCTTGSGYIDNNEEGLIQCCEEDGCNGAPRVLVASMPAVALLLGLIAFLRL